MKKRILLLAAAQALIVTIPMATHAYAEGTRLEVKPAEGATVIGPTAIVAPAVNVNAQPPASDPHIGTAAVKLPPRAEPPRLRAPLPGPLPLPR